MRTALSMVPPVPVQVTMHPDDLLNDLLVGQVLDGRYTLEALIGEGATGRVYRARQEATGREVAVKLLRDTLVGDHKSLQRFQREARAASRINHPNAIMVHDFGRSADGHVYLVTELVEGETLRTALDRDGLPAPARALWIFREILAGVAAAHERGVVHRDLHPGNIFLCREEHPFRGDGGRPWTQDRVKVFDFGGARLLDSQEDGEITGVGHLDLRQLLGSIRYLAPERLQRDRRPDPRSDVYSLGLILFELCTGRYPFDSDDPLQVMAMHLREPPPLLLEHAPERIFSPALQGLVASMLAKEPHLRPCDAAEVAQRLALAEEREALISIREVVPEPEIEMEMEALPADEGGSGPVRWLPESTPAPAFADMMPPEAGGWAASSISVEADYEDAPVAAAVAPEVPPPLRSEPELRVPTLPHTRTSRVLVAVLCVLLGAAIVFVAGLIGYGVYQRLHHQRTRSIAPVTQAAPGVDPPTSPTAGPVAGIEPPPAPLHDE